MRKEPQIALYFYAAVIILLAPLVSIACGQVIQPISTTDATANKLSISNPVLTPTPIPTLTDFAATTRQVIVTADTLTIRPQPSTVGTLGYLHAGQIVTVGILVTNGNADCQNWYPLQSPNGWICADFTEAVK